MLRDAADVGGAQADDVFLRRDGDHKSGKSLAVGRIVEQRDAAHFVVATRRAQRRRDRVARGVGGERYVANAKVDGVRELANRLIVGARRHALGANANEREGVAVDEIISRICAQLVDRLANQIGKRPRRAHRFSCAKLKIWKNQIEVENIKAQFIF